MKYTRVENMEEGALKMCYDGVVWQAWRTSRGDGTL